MRAAEASREAIAVRGDDTAIEQRPSTSRGVATTDVAALFGPAVNGAVGGARFALDEPGDGSHLGCFSMSLDSFAAGYLLPSLPGEDP